MPEGVDRSSGLAAGAAQQLAGGNRDLGDAAAAVRPVVAVVRRLAGNAWLRRMRSQRLGGSSGRGMLLCLWLWLLLLYRFLSCRLFFLLNRNIHYHFFFLLLFLRVLDIVLFLLGVALGLEKNGSVQGAVVL